MTSGLALMAGAVLAALLFLWGWIRATGFRSQHGKPPWNLSPVIWGALHVTVLPLAWIMYYAASKTTATADISLAHRSDSIIADSFEEREKLRRIASELPLARPPEPASAGWHPDPFRQRHFRYFDGNRWTREVTNDPIHKVAAYGGNTANDRRRRLDALPAPADKTPSWHIDPLGPYGYRYFDGTTWTEQVVTSRYA